jgi:hypothetical protein
MEITKTPNGWLVEPSTKAELDHLAFMLEALRLAYCQAAEVNSEDSCSATQSSSLDGTQSMAS